MWGSRRAVQKAIRAIHKLQRIARLDSASRQHRRALPEPRQQTIRIIKVDNFPAPDQLQPRKCEQCVQCPCFAQKNMASAVNELKRLDNKLNLADAAAAELHVALERVGSHDFTLDS